MTLFNLNELDDITTEPKTIVKKGELWQLGKHRLLCGDATIKSDVEKLMDEAKVDMVFTDPPYNIAYNEPNKNKRMNEVLGNKLENHIVYDCFLGSGSTLIACEYTKRICYGLEIDEHYCGVIIDRWEKMTHKKARRLA